MFADEHLLLVLHKPPRPDQDEREGRFVWRKPDGTWASNDLGGGPGAVAKHLDEFGAIVDRCEKMEHDAKSSEDYFRVLEELAPLQRAASNLHNTLQEARKLVPDDREIINLRDRAYDLQRTTELLYTTTKNSLDFAIARRAEEQAQSSHQMAISAHRLNLLAAFFFPLATLCALLGVNLKHGLEDSPFSPIPFLVLVFLGLFSGMVMTTFVTRSGGREKNSTT
jgi:Mg2+ and Co2+ transporter CorA